MVRVFLSCGNLNLYFSFSVCLGMIFCFFNSSFVCLLLYIKLNINDGVGMIVGFYSVCVYFLVKFLFVMIFGVILFNILVICLLFNVWVIIFVMLFR